MARELIELPYEHDALEPWITSQVLEWHHGTHHQGYVNGINKAEERLEEQREKDDYSNTGAIIRNFTHNFSGDVLHELFWYNLSANSRERPEGSLMEKIQEDFGSYENWVKEFKAAAANASGWTLLVYIPRMDQLHNVVVDKHDQGAVWGSHPILALDVWEHSYYHDYGPDRSEFVDNFFDMIDWEEVEKRYSELV